MTVSTPSDLTPAKYKAMRKNLDTRRAVARALGVHHETMLRRERGAAAISVEAGLALRFLAKHGLPRYLRARKTVDVIPKPGPWAKPGELREALAILGWSIEEAARTLLGSGRGPASRMSRYVTGDRPVPKHVALMVKRRLGLMLEDEWPKRKAMEWGVGMDGIERVEG